MSSDRFGSPVHLARRFFTSLRSTPPPAADEAWAVLHLLPGEVALWARLSASDRRHAIGVGRSTVSLLGIAGGAVGRGAGGALDGGALGRALDGGAAGGALDGAAVDGLGAGGALDRAVVAAALLHDVGKIEARLGTVGRAAVTALALVVGPDRLGGRPAQYLQHSSIGAQLLAAAGSDPLTIAWTLEHHLPAGAWSVPPAIGAALKVADDD